MSDDDHEKQLVCFICSASSSSQLKLLGESLSSWPSDNLNVIFLLRNLLHIPKIYLVNHLKKCGRDPHNWLHLCDPCIQLIGVARALHQKIQKIEKELKSIETQVVKKIIGATNNNHLNKQNQRKTRTYRGKGRCNDKDANTTAATSFQEKVTLLVKRS